MKYLTIGVLVFLASILPKHVQAQNYDPSFFPIGVWSIRGDFRNADDYLYDPEKAAVMHDKLFSDLEAGGFNTAYMSLEPITPTIDTLLDIAQQHNIKISPFMRETTYLLKDSISANVSDALIESVLISDSIYHLKDAPATLGYYIFDEPLIDKVDFDLLKRVKDKIVAMTGGNHPIVSTWNYEPQMDYIDSYLNVDVLMMDAYPFSDSTTEGSLAGYMPDYFGNYAPGENPAYSDYLELVRKDHCNNQNNRPMWVVVQSFGDAIDFDPDDEIAKKAFWRQVTPKEIRLQVWVALMHGAKGIWYFTYETEHPWHYGMLDIDGISTPRLDEAIAVNGEINKISEILLKLDVVEDAAVSVDEGEIRFHTDLTANTDNKYAIVVNSKYTHTDDINVTINKSEIGYEVNSIVDQVTDENIPFTETATTIEFVASLGQADGTLYHISAQPPLPIEMATFTVTKSNDYVRLDWLTLSEKNNKGFSIEKSTDGYSWKTIGFAHGQGDSNAEVAYSFIDKTPSQGVSYYRLLQTDYDGFSSYSKIVQIFFEGHTLGFYPNPADQTIHFLTQGKTLDKVFIFNALGQPVTQTLPKDKTLDISHLHSGIYTILAQAEGEVLRARLTVK